MTAKRDFDNESRAPMRVADEVPWKVKTHSFSLSNPQAPNDKTEVSHTHGTLTIDTFGTSKIDLGDTNSRYSRIPVILVNETPVASGFGRVHIVLPVGTYMVSVIVQGPDHTSIGFPVTILANQTETLHYAMPHDFHHGGGLDPRTRSALGELGPPGIHGKPSTSLVPPVILGALLGYTSALVTLFPIWYLVAHRRNDSLDFDQDVFFPATPFAWIYVIAGVIVALWWKYQRDRRKAAVTEGLQTAVQASWQSTNDSFSLVKVTGLSDNAPAPPMERGKSGIVIDLRLGNRKTQLNRFNSAKNDLAPWRVAAPPPIATFNGEELPRGWGRWFLEVEPHSHSLILDLPDQYGRPSHHSGTPVTNYSHLACEPDTIINFTGIAHINYSWNEETMESVKAHWEVAYS